MRDEAIRPNARSAAGVIRRFDYGPPRLSIRARRGESCSETLVGPEITETPETTERVFQTEEGAG
jgi:hypothetical protein